MRTEIIKAHYPGLDMHMAIHVEHEVFSDTVRTRNGHYSNCDLITYDLLLRPGDFVIDGGANVGWYTLYAAHKVGRGGVIYAIEPEPRNVELLQENIRLNVLSQVQVFEAALAEESGHTRLYLSQANFGGHSISDVPVGDWTHITVPKITLAELIQKQGYNPRLIKLDVQGAEPRALAGLGTYAQVGTPQRPYLLIEFAPGYITRLGGSPFEILAFIEKNRYLPYCVIDEPQDGHVFVPVSVQALLDLIKDTREGGGFWELLLVPREQLVEWELLLSGR